MKSFEHDYLLDTPISHAFLANMRFLGECRGRQALYGEQSPEVLETLRRAAIIQSSESSNRIEGITARHSRIEKIVIDKVKPQDRSEQEIAGYRDVLNTIHVNHGRMKLSSDLLLGWHGTLGKYTKEKTGVWKPKDNAILEVRPDGRAVVRFKTVSALATPEFTKKLISHYSRLIDDNKTDQLLLIASCILDFECIHPFSDGNGRIGRLLTLYLLYTAGYEVGRYISLERIVEQSKESYYEALNKSSLKWHEGEHDLRPWWNYFIGMLTAAYKEFEERVGTITTVRGAKRVMVENAILHLPNRFRIADIQRACPAVSYPTLKRALSNMANKKRIRCLGKGRDAEWERIVS
ncbi:MAG: Fic family protein [Chitinispirillaceae bacterium]|nr:Fic family protein [Chitinispirillaceae bacterium]